MKKFSLAVTVRDCDGHISTLNFSARTFAECAKTISLIEDSEDFELVAVVATEKA